jgi:hypothetical protein
MASHRSVRHASLLIALVAAAPVAARAQYPTAAPDTTHRADSAKKATAESKSAPKLDFSGWIFGNFQVRTDAAARAANGGTRPNQFTIERSYLTFRMPAGDRAAVRVTGDLFQQTNPTTSSFYRGWVLRLKYAYLQYSFQGSDAPPTSLAALARIGILHTVIIDHEELFWPRYLNQVGVERNGFFSSADLGVAGQITLPSKFGEIYGTVTNGPGYTSFETDRFKDYALRVSITPLGQSAGFLKTFTISPWGYLGQLASAFALGGAGQLGPVRDGLDRNRWGIFAGLRDPRLTVGADYAQRIDQTESGQNTPASPRVVTKTTGELIDAFALIRPLQFADPKAKPSVGAILRWDRFKPDKDVSAHNEFYILGAFWEPTPKTALALDYQLQTPESGSTTPRQATWFLHWQAIF